MPRPADIEELLSQPESFPFLSVYLDLGPQSRANRIFETILRKRFSELEELVAARGEHEEAFWQAVKQVWDYIHNNLPASGHGVALFVAPRIGLLRDYVVAYRFETEVVLDDRPYVRPLAHVVEEHEHYLVVEVHADRASIFMVHLRAPTPVSTLAELESEVPAKTSQGGWSQRRFQWHRRDHILRHIKKVAEAAAALFDQYNCAGVILLGQDPNISELRKHLPRRMQDAVVAVAPERADKTEQALLEKVLPLLEAEERLEELGAVARLVEELGRGGLAAAGPEPVTAAAVEGRIDILLVLDGLRLTGYECSSCGALMTPEATDGQCIYCGARVDAIDLTEALIKVAESQGATVEIVANDERLEKLGGVGALLRF